MQNDYDEVRRSYEAGGNAIDPRNPDDETFVAFPDEPKLRDFDDEKFQVYLEHQRAGRQVFVDMLEDALELGQVSPLFLENYLKTAHIACVTGADGKRNIREDVKNPGEFRESYYYSKLNESVMSEVQAVADSLGVKINKQIRLRRFTNPLNKDNAIGWTNSSLVRNYPEAGFVKKYMRIATEVFNEYLETPADSQVETVRKIAELHQILAVSHPFEAVNQSLAMNLANAMLEMRGINGVPHGITDAIAMHLDPVDYQRFFVEMVLGSEARQSLDRELSIQGRIRPIE